MAYSKIETTVIDMAKPITDALGCFVYDVEFVKEGGVYFLRVFADRDGGIDLDTCESISRRLSDALDISDPIKQNYYLEVSSPGIERKLKTKEHFERYIGETIDVGLYKAIGGSKQLTCTLKGFEDGVILVENCGETIKIAQKETTFVKIHFDF